MNLEDFVRESNRIEGIHRSPLPHEIMAHREILSASELTISDLRWFVAAVEPGAILRDRFGLDVGVGRYVAPRGGPKIVEQLTSLLAEAKRPSSPRDAFLIHHAYEQLHPFMDGNGRSGRVIWLWMMGGVAPLGFLHHWYYQSLGIEAPEFLDRLYYVQNS